MPELRAHREPRPEPIGSASLDSNALSVLLAPRDFNLPGSEPGPITHDASGVHASRNRHPSEMPRSWARLAASDKLIDPGRVGLETIPPKMSFMRVIRATCNMMGNLRKLRRLRRPDRIRKGDKDVVLRLQPLIDDCYRDGRYQKLDSRADPRPRLDEDDARWADELLRQQKRR